MYSLLLRKALPFALTFILGSLVGGLFKAVGVGGPSAGHPRAFYYGYGEGHSCRMRARQRYLVAESKPLLITFKPDARYARNIDPVRVRVTFGADGKVQNVEPVSPEPGTCQMKWMDSVTHKWKAVETAARQIEFEPETVDDVPVTVTRDIEIRFMGE
jgi:hypothetical protein